MKKKQKAVRYYSSCGSGVLKGFVKNGLDSSTIINMISTDPNFLYFKRGFPFPPNLFYFHEFSWPEVVGVLINKYDFSKDNAKAALKKLVKNVKIF